MRCVGVARSSPVARLYHVACVVSDCRWRMSNGAITYPATPREQRRKILLKRPTELVLEAVIRCR